MDPTPPRPTLLNRTFFVSLILKGLDGVLELVGGVLLLLVSPTQINAIVRFLTQHELSEDPHDPIANWLVHAAGNLNASASLFGALYLLLHGLVKVILVWAVLKDHLWAYPWMICFLLIFVVFQTYTMIRSFSVGLFVLTGFDIFIIVLTWREYRIQRGKSK